MLQRILEPEVMDTQAESIAYDDMDHSPVNETFVSDMLAADALDDDAEILDLGTGTARIPILLCEQTENARVLAVDLSESMLDIARLNIEIASLSSRIMLDRLDAKALPFAADRFDAVMSNSIIHHIPDPSTTFAEAARVCKPGGLIFVRDLSRPGSVADIKTLSQQYASQESEHARKLFEDSLHAALTIDEVKAIVCDLKLNPDDVQASSDRHWTWSTLKPDNAVG